MELLKGASVVQALALLTDIKQGWKKVLPRMDTLDYYKKVNYGRKKFYDIGYLIASWLSPLLSPRSKDDSEI